MEENEEERVSITLVPQVGSASQIIQKPFLPEDKREKEKRIVEEFSVIQTINGKKLNDIEINTDDSSGQPDVNASLDGEKIGIQLTELKFGHRPESEDVSNRLTNKIIDKILETIKPDVPIVANICTHYDHLNIVLHMRKKHVNELSKIIIEGIRNKEYSTSFIEMQKSPASISKTKLLPIPKSLKKVISGLFIQKIPEGDISYCPGREKLYVNFGFKQITYSKTILIKMVETIIEKKKESKADILMIWSGDIEFLSKEEIIVSIISDKIKNLSFPYIFYFSFLNTTEAFNANKKVFKIR